MGKMGISSKSLWSKKTAYLFVFPLSVLLLDVLKIIIFRYPITLFIPFSIIYSLMISMTIIIFICLGNILKKTINIQIYLIWPILFAILLRLSVYPARPIFMNAILLILLGACISIIIGYVSKYRKIPKRNYALYSISLIILCLMSVKVDTIVFLLFFCIPLLFLLWGSMRYVPLLSFVLILNLHPSFYDGKIPINSSKVKSDDNVILIVLDTARKDCIDLINENTITPNIKEFAEEGIVFNKFVTNGAWTPPTHASLFTGLLPSNHGVFHFNNTNGYSVLSDELDTLAEILKRNGINTAGFFANSVISKEFGFGQGFHPYKYIPPKSPDVLTVVRFVETNIKRAIPYLPFSINKYRFIAADYKNSVALSGAVMKKAQKWIKQNGVKQNFFLFINLMEQHYIRYFMEPVSRKFKIGPKDYYEDQEILYLKPETMKRRNRELLEWHKNTIRNVDVNIGLFFNMLKEIGLYNKSTIIITSDHGELFGEKCRYGHQDNIYLPNTFVPLLIKFSKKNGRRNSHKNRIYQQVDIFAEILDLFHISMPPDIHGKPFSSKKGNRIITQLYPKKNIPESLMDLLQVELCGTVLNIDGSYYHLIYSSKNAHEMYEIRDFVEYKGLNRFRDFEENSEVTDYIQACPEILQRKTPDNETEYDKKALERLKALGYIY